jgi:hypothetical protein
MLIKDPLYRIKPEEALLHPYFVKTGMIKEPVKVTLKPVQQISEPKSVADNNP